MIWARMPAYITGTVDQELLLRNEHLAAENRILRAQIKGRLLLSDSEKATLAAIAHRLGRKALADVAAAAKPDTLFRWYRELIAKKFDGSKFRKSLGRPPVAEEIARLVVRMARENLSWGYDRIVGAMANLGYRVSDQTVGNILKRHDIPPAPKRKQTTSWKDFIRAHMGGHGGDGLLHSGSAYPERLEDILRAVLHSLGEPEDMRRGSHSSSGSGVDGANGAQRHNGGEWVSGELRVFAS